MWSYGWHWLIAYKVDLDFGRIFYWLKIQLCIYPWCVQKNRVKNDILFKFLLIFYFESKEVQSMKNQCMYYVSIFWILPLNFQLNFLILKIGSSKIRNLKIKSVVLYPVIIHNLVLLSTEYQSNIDNCLRSPLFILSGHKKHIF